MTGIIMLTITRTGTAIDHVAAPGTYNVVRARRDIRRYRPDSLDPAVLERVLVAGHNAPSVGQSQPWRFVVVTKPETRERAALLADQERLAQAAKLEPEAARHLLDLQLEGIREAPVGIVVCWVAIPSMMPICGRVPARFKTSGWPRVPRALVSAGSRSSNRPIWLHSLVCLTALKAWAGCVSGGRTSDRPNLVSNAGVGRSGCRFPTW
jgi:hypothetical protein